MLQLQVSRSGTAIVRNILIGGLGKDGKPRVQTRAIQKDKSALGLHAWPSP
jgi:hypothetical protein